MLDLNILGLYIFTFSLHLATLTPLTTTTIRPETENVTSMRPISATKMIEMTSFNATAIAGQTSNNKMTSMITNGKGSETTKKTVLTTKPSIRTKSTIKPNPDGSIFYFNLVFMIL